VQRFFCPPCKKTFTRLPSFLIPFKHYVAAEIEGVIGHIANGGRLINSPSEADESTLRRWWKEFRHKLPQWAGLLEAQIFRLSGRPPSYIAFFPDPLKRLVEDLSQITVLPAEWPVLVKAIWWLSTSHPL
jgi:hypothetical protein